MMGDRQLKDLEKRYKDMQSALQKLRLDADRLNREYDVRSSKLDAIQDAVKKEMEKYNSMKKKRETLELQLRQSKNELQIVQKAIELETMKQLTEKQKAEADQKYLEAIDRYLYCDDFTTNFLKNLGNRKRHKPNGEIKVENIYSIYLEGRERARRRAIGRRDDLRRPLPKGGDSGGRVPPMAEESLGF